MKAWKIELVISVVVMFLIAIPVGVYLARNWSAMFPTYYHESGTIIDTFYFYKCGGRWHGFEIENLTSDVSIYFWHEWDEHQNMDLGLKIGDNISFTWYDGVIPAELQENPDFPARLITEFEKEPTP